MTEISQRIITEILNNKHEILIFYLLILILGVYKIVDYLKKIKNKENQNIKSESKKMKLINKFDLLIDIICIFIFMYLIYKLFFDKKNILLIYSIFAYIYLSIKHFGPIYNGTIKYSNIGILKRFDRVAFVFFPLCIISITYCAYEIDFLQTFVKSLIFNSSYQEFILVIILILKIFFYVYFVTVNLFLFSYFISKNMLLFFKYICERFNRQIIIVKRIYYLLPNKSKILGIGIVKKLYNFLMINFKNKNLLKKGSILLLILFFAIIETILCIILKFINLIFSAIKDILFAIKATLKRINEVIKFEKIVLTQRFIYRWSKISAIITLIIIYIILNNILGSQNNIIKIYEWIGSSIIIPLVFEQIISLNRRIK